MVQAYPSGGTSEIPKGSYLVDVPWPDAGAGSAWGRPLPQATAFGTGRPFSERVRAQNTNNLSLHCVYCSPFSCREHTVGVLQSHGVS